MKAASEARPANIASRLSEHARREPGTPAVIAGGRSLTFGELDTEVSRLASGLSKVGIKRGVRTAVMVPPSPEFVSLAFALFRVGAIPVLIDPGLGLGGLGDCLAEARPEAFIGSRKAQLARGLGGWAKESLRVCVSVGWWPGTLSLSKARRPGTARVFQAAVGAQETAAILFTSGSTGVPKGAVYTHGIFSAQVDLLRQLFGTLPGEVSVPTFPLFALFDVALGMTVVLPEMDATRPAKVDPRKIIEPIMAHGASQLFGSPALLDVVGRWAEARGLKLPSLKRVISAGAPVPAAVLARFSKLLSQDAQVYTPYGATEALPVSLVGSREVLGETAARTAEGRGICVGRPVPGVEVSVIEVSDEAIPAWSKDLEVSGGEIGEFAVKGPVVTQRYDGRPDLTALSKMRGAGGEVWHRMGDLGWRDDRGRLWFCGRKSQRVVTPIGTLYTIPCEAVFNQHPQVRRTALVGVGPEGSQIPVLCVELEGRGAREKVKEELLALGGRHAHTRAIQTILFHPRFPVDIRHNAKIFREKLALWAAERVK